MSFWAGVFVGFILSVAGSVIMWVTFGDWIVGRRVDKGINEFKTGKYDEVIEEAAVKAVNSIIDNPQLRKEVTNMLNGYATAFSKMAIGRFTDAIKDQFGVDVSQVARDYTSGGGGIPGINPEKIITRIINGIFPE